MRVPATTLLASPNPARVSDEVTIRADNYSGTGFVIWDGPEARGFLNYAGSAVFRPSVPGRYVLELVPTSPKHPKSLAMTVLNVGT